MSPTLLEEVSVCVYVRVCVCVCVCMCVFLLAIFTPACCSM